MTDATLAAAHDSIANGLHRVTFLPGGATVDCAPGKAVLESAIAAGFFPKHSCRRGECNACAARIVSGAVNYPDGFVPGNIATGQCLTCMAMPIGDLVLESPEVATEPGRRIVQAGARVQSVEHVSHDVAIVRLQVQSGTEFSFVPGQYVDVLLRDGTRRSYSMANAPDDTGLIEWHVRAIPDGRFSNHVYQSLKPRDLVRIEGPFGAFALSQSNRPVVLLASGTGYAPIAAFIKAHGVELAARGAALYWGGRRREDLYAFEEAEQWAQNDARVRFVPVLSDPEVGWWGRTGFVHEAVAADVPDLSGHEVYACGNPLMVDAARSAFTQANRLPVTSFFSDAFVSRIERVQTE
ncbi:CDP-6-deoxy-delta-3,4-glucoseen reductase [Burkholderia sp. Bp9140]|uniref:FAD-binding oxidoreductase n=1 Tax=Burkholderia sp. Bp9140 TaxID=2184572 RepID=UPI000F58D1E6|nr:FAD-binding oxidoreductase [Burkholderia sp. Bp9140]RQR43663.1 CDP-6-deoxy-delta-3,4-glucoseen reductase [Burkholderia sp. Bp9140]